MADTWTYEPRTMRWRLGHRGEVVRFGATYMAYVGGVFVQAYPNLGAAKRAVEVLVDG